MLSNKEEVKIDTSTSRDFQSVSPLTHGFPSLGNSQEGHSFITITKYMYLIVSPYEKSTYELVEIETNLFVSYIRCEHKTSLETVLSFLLN